MQKSGVPRPGWRCREPWASRMRSSGRVGGRREAPGRRGDREGDAGSPGPRARDRGLRGAELGAGLTMEEDAETPGRRGRGAGMQWAPRRRRTWGRALPSGSLSGAIGASTGKWRPLNGSLYRSQLLNLRGKIIIIVTISRRGGSKSSQEKAAAEARGRSQPCLPGCQSAIKVHRFPAPLA